MSLKRIEDRRRIYYKAGYLFLILINITILVLGMVLIFKLLSFFK